MEAEGSMVDPSLLLGSPALQRWAAGIGGMIGVIALLVLLRRKRQYLAGGESTRHTLQQIWMRGQPAHDAPPALTVPLQAATDSVRSFLLVRV